MEVLLSFIFSLLLASEVDANVVVLKHEVNVVVNNGKRSTEKKVLIQVNNRKGDWVTDVSIPFKLNNRPKNVQARILTTALVEVKKLKKKDITEESDVSRISLYEDDMSLNFDLRYNVYPYLLEYSYTTVDQEFMWLANWIPAFRNQQTVSSSLTVEVPSGYQINFYERGVEPANQKRLESGNTQYRWEIDSVKRIEGEYDSPAWYNLTPMVKVVPVLMEYGVTGTTNTWQEYGRWVYDIGEESNDLRPADIEILEKVVVDRSDTRAVAKQLYEYLQDEMRYVNISMGVGGMKPYSASYVMDNKYGDCKALTYFMKSALDHFDIESYPVDVYWSGDQRELLDELPSQQFNHVFLAVPVDGDTLWLENTSKTYPFNYLDISKHGTQGLLIDKEQSHLIRLPKTAIDELASHAKVTFDLEDLILKGEMDSEFKGEDFEDLIYVAQAGNETDKMTWMRNHFLYQNCEVTDYEILIGSREDTKVGFTASFDLNGHVKMYGDNHVIFLPDLVLPDLEKPEDRILPLHQTVPVHYQDSIYYNLPVGVLDVEFPASEGIDSDLGHYSFAYAKVGSQVLVTRKILIHPNIFSVGEEYQTYYDFIEAILEKEDEAYFNFKLLSSE